MRGLSAGVRANGVLPQGLAEGRPRQRGAAARLELPHIVGA